MNDLVSISEFNECNQPVCLCISEFDEWFDEWMKPESIYSSTCTLGGLLGKTKQEGGN